MAAAPFNKAATVASLPAPKNLFKPRSGVGYALWNNDITNRLATCRLLDTSSQPPPDFEDMAATFPYKSGREQYSLWMTAIGEYREENTLIYNLVMSTIDLSGNREETDIDYLARHFHHGIHRDGQVTGRGLLGGSLGLMITLMRASRTGCRPSLRAPSSRRRRPRSPFPLSRSIARTCSLCG